MIELFSLKSPLETLAQLKTQGASLPQLKRELKAVRDDLIKGNVKHIGEFQLFNVTDFKGNIYEEVEFIVTSRYRKSGDVFLAGEEFFVNVSLLLRQAQAALKLWNK